jgi:hypothetical protein
MSQLSTIEIDFDVHKRIETERRSFSETPNEVLRRLLLIDSAPIPQSDARAWSGKGMSLPHGSEIRMEYNGRVHSGVIQDGEWVVEGHRFKSPSGAATGVARTKAGKHTNLDGWNYWQFRRPGESHWTPIRALKGR